jgi:hypothetical protein
MSDVKLPTRSQDTPATQGMLLEFRGEMNHQLSGLRNHTESRFDKIESCFDLIDSRFDKIDSRFNKMESRFDKIDSRFNTLEAKLDAMHALMHAANLRAEEQRSENRVVMDGLTSLFQRQDRVEKRVDAVEKNVGSLGL